MKLSEQLKQDHECGDFGKALEGYSERAERLELMLWNSFYSHAICCGFGDAKSREIADNHLADL